MAGSGTAHLGAVNESLLHVEHLVVRYKLADGATVQAVSDVSLDIRAGETLGLVGESGCGKSTLGRAITMLRSPQGGRIHFKGEELTAASDRRLRELRTSMQVIFQDPISSLNPRRKVRQIVAEGPAIWRRRYTADDVDGVLSAVGLDPSAVGERRPHEFSGGQCQRIAIARALMLNPDLVVCDEPVSALDVSVQAQILNLLQDMKQRYGLTLLFIAHDLAVVRHVSDRVAVMYLGKLCEVAPSEQLYSSPQHPYTRALLEAVPSPDPDAQAPPLEISGDLPSPVSPPSGCRFRTRCPRAQERCADEEPIIRELQPGHFTACHFPGDGYG